MNHRPESLRPILATMALCLPAAAQSDAAAEAWRAFLKLPATRQEQSLDALVAAMPSHPLVKALLGLVATNDRAQQTRGKAEPVRRRPATKGAAPAAAMPLPMRVEYQFGGGTIVACADPIGPLDGARKAPAKGRPKGKGRDPLLLQHALLGCVHDADQVVAGILQQLDTDRRADAFAAFLNGWRAGDESFYTALDRTAGTQEGVFFFDAMLDEFCAAFGKGKDGTPLKKSLDAAQGALHQGFLAYRQYRGFREAVAWSLVLPPDAPLPRHLQRYDVAGAGTYSLRQQVLMVSKAMDHDVRSLLAAIGKSAPALPQPLWQGSYDPFPAWNAVFQELMPKMLSRHESTDAFLAAVVAERLELAAQLRAAAMRQLQSDALAGKAAVTGLRR